MRTIVAGERGGHVLAAIKNVRIHASANEIAKRLQGNWRIKHLFALKQPLAVISETANQAGAS